MATKGQDTSSEVNETAVLRAAQGLTQETSLFAVPNGNGEDVQTLTPVQWQAIGLLVSGKRQVDIAQELDIAPETLSRWKQSPVFAAACNFAVRESYTAALGELRDARSEAIAALRKLITDEYSDERLRLQAAKTVLALGLELDAGALELETTPAKVASERLKQLRWAHYDL